MSLPIETRPISTSAYTKTTVFKGAPLTTWDTQGHYAVTSILLPVAEGLADSAASAMLDSEASLRGDSAASFVDLGAVVWN